MAKASKDSGYVDNWQAEKTVTECNLHMLTTEDCSDVIFRVGSEKHVVRAHRYVLVSRSCVFHAMLWGPLAEKGEVTIPDINPLVFKEFLRYLYTDTANITAVNVTGLLYSSRKYAVDGLLSQCSAFLEKSLSEENVCQILEQCHSYGELDVEQKALKILTGAGEMVIKSPGFLELCDTCLNKFLKSEDLRLTEEEIFEAVLSWSRKKCKKDNVSRTPENLRKCLGEMRYEIRFSALPQDYLVSVVGPSGILTTDERLKIMDRSINTNIDITPFKPSLRTNGKRSTHQRKSFKVRRYNRVSSGWNGCGLKNAVSFFTNKNIKLLGCELYGPSHLSWSLYILNIRLYDEKNQLIAEPVPSTDRQLKGEKELNDVIFPHPLTLVAGLTYTICVTMKGERIDYGEEGNTFVKVDGVEFTFKDSPISTTGWTTATRGQIPGLIARLM